MRLLPSMEKRSNEDELMDHHTVQKTEFVRALKEIRWVNRYLGGTSALLSQLTTLCDSIPASGAPTAVPIRVLDLGTGSADIPIAIAEWGRAHQRAFQITAVDFHPTAVEQARIVTRAYPEIDVQEGNALALPFATQTFDFVVSSMFLHHLDSVDAVRLLQNMAYLSSQAFIVNDLERHPLAWLGIRLLSIITMKGFIFKNDSALSVLRGFKRSELINLCRRAGLSDAHVTHRHPYRWLITWKRN